MSIFSPYGKTGNRSGCSPTCRPLADKSNVPHDCYVYSSGFDPVCNASIDSGAYHEALGFGITNTERLKSIFFPTITSNYFHGSTDGTTSVDPPGYSHFNHKTTANKTPGCTEVPVFLPTIAIFMGAECIVFIRESTAGTCHVPG